MLCAMNQVLAPIRRAAPALPAPSDVLARARELALALAPEDGHRNLLMPSLCLYRFSRPTTFTKAATFGVTLGVVLQGAKTVRIGSHALELEPARLLVITRESEHESMARVASIEQPYVGLSLCFDPERVARALVALAEAGAPEQREAVPAFVLDCDAEIADALARLLQALRDPVDRRLLAPLVMDEILYRLLRSEAAAAVRSGVRHAPDAPRILESMRIMRAEHADKLVVGELARRAGMSASHYAHRFRAVARISPMRFLRDVRLERARELLLEDGARAGDVGLHVGFESPAHFAREFKRRYGVPPSHYLRTRGVR